MTDYRFISLSTVVSIIASEEGSGAFNMNIGMLWAGVLITGLLHVSSYLELAYVVCYACMLLSMYSIVIECAYVSHERSLYIVNN